MARKQKSGRLGLGGGGDFYGRVSDAVAAGFGQDLGDDGFGDVYEGLGVLYFDGTDEFAGDVGVEGDCADDVVGANALLFTGVHDEPYHAVFVGTVVPVGTGFPIGTTAVGTAVFRS